MENSLKQRWAGSTLLHIAVLIFLILIIYSNTFDAPFQWDEDGYLKDNPIVKDLRYFLSPSEAQGLKYYNFLILRYVGYLTFALQYSIHGFSVIGYHIVNIAIHMTNTILVYFLVLLTFRTPFMEKSSLQGQAPSVAFFSSLLFAAHPLQTMAVTYVFQRFASLAAMLYLIALTAYIQSRLAEEKRKRVLFYSIALISSVLAMKTKEIAFTLPIMIALYEFLFFRGALKRRMLSLAPMLFTLCIIPLTLEGLKDTQPLPGSYGAGVFGREEYVITELRVLVTYLRLLFFPVNQNINYDYPLFTSFFAPHVMLSAVFLLALFGFGVFLVVRSQSRPHVRLMGFGILWFFISLSVESSIIPLDRLIDEYRMYLPSVGVSMFVVIGAFLLKEKMQSLKTQKTVPVLLFLAVGILSTVTYLRNEVWGDSIRLWQDTVNKSPLSSKAHDNLAFAYKGHNMLDKAIEHYLIAIKLQPSNERAHYGLGLLYCKQGRDTECAYEINTSYAINHYNRGVAYTKRSFFREALQEFETAAKLKPDFAEAHHNLGFLYESLNMPDKAVEHYQAAISLKPDISEAHFNLGTLYYKIGQREKAQRELKAGLQMKPGDRQSKELLEAISR